VTRMIRGQGAASRPQGRWLLCMAFWAAWSAGADAGSFEQTLASNDAGSMLELGKRYFYGVTVPQSIDHAIQLYCGAARLGNGEAQYRLGEIYSRTTTGRQDEVLAAAWFLRSALSKYDAAKKPLSRWDLTAVDIPAEPGCVLSANMMARTMPRAKPAEAAQASKAVAAAPAPSPALGDVVKRRDVERLVRGMAPEFGLSPELVLAVIEVESNFNPKAQSPKQAQGLMQLIPATARRFGVSDPWDPQQNVRGGMKYLSWLLDHFDGDVRLALAGYNAGEKAVKRYGGVPPYGETRGYLRRVSRVLGVSEEGLSAYQGRPNVFVAPRREADAESKKDWESRFFEVDLSG